MKRNLLALTVLLWSTWAAAEKDPLIYAVVVGNNDGLDLLPQLHYADDDALRFYRLATRLAPEQNVALLTELDVDTWRRIQITGLRPPPFLPPTKKKLLEVIELFKLQIAKARQDQPDRPVHFYFFFSGHGERGYFLLKKDGNGLADSALTGPDLERTFADSRATLNGLFIDACKSQSLFTTKGRSEEEDELGPDFSGLINQIDRAASLSPIGVITSTVSDKPAGEARDIQGGYFSHVLTSGLSGAADANSDGVVRYGELAAFVSFHTRRIAGQVPWFRLPQGRLDAPLAVLKDRQDLLEILPGLGGHFAVFDAQGHNLLLEMNKTEAQWTRLILPPDRYKVVWVSSTEYGLAAEVDLRKGAQRLMLSSFTRPVTFGHERVPKGEGLGAPPDPEDAVDMALRAYDPASSGFDQPFTPRVVTALAAAYNAGLSASPSLIDRQNPVLRHLVSVGYGFFSPPIEPFSAGQGISLGYAYRLDLPIQLGGRAIFTTSDHSKLSDNRSFRMFRFIVQTEALARRSFRRRFEASAGLYLGWQMVRITEKQLDMLHTFTYEDPTGFRTGLLGAFRVNVFDRLYVSASAAWGLELIHEKNIQEEEKSITFLRPEFSAHVGYAF